MTLLTTFKTAWCLKSDDYSIKCYVTYKKKNVGCSQLQYTINTGSSAPKSLRHTRLNLKMFIAL